MKALAAGLLLLAPCVAPLSGQERDRALERISLSLVQPPPALRIDPPIDGAPPKTFGIFTLVPPAMRGEMVRVSVPVGDLVSRAVKGVAAANRRRQEAAVRREIAAELARVTAQPAAPKP